MNQLYQDEFFGLYLLNKNYINYPLLYKTSELQKKLNKKIGDWAVELGFLSHEQVEIIYNEQKRTNNYFGEIAIKKELLTAANVETIVKKQKESHTFIGEILQLMGYLTQAQLDDELDYFTKLEHKRLNNINNFTKENIDYFEHLDLVLDAAEHTVYRMLLISLKISGNIARVKEIKNSYDLYRVTFKGDKNFSIFYNFDRMFADDAVFNFFNSYPRKKVITMRASILQELSNIVSGVITTDFSNLKDISYNISVPEKITDKIITFDKELFKIPFISPDGVLELYILPE